MLKKYKHIFSSKSFAFLIYNLIIFYSRTFRLKVENEDQWFKYLKQNHNILLCLWHQQFFGAIRYFKKYAKFNPCIMISQSMDGEIIANIASLTGWEPVRGSSSKDGAKALKELIEKLKNSHLAVHILDGPLGPVGKIKKGALIIADKAKASIVPCYICAESAWFFNSWDNFFIPKPFSKVKIRFGDIININDISCEHNLKKEIRKIEKIMRPWLCSPKVKISHRP